MDPQPLETIWYGLLAVVWMLYLVLGGIDLGIGQLVRRTDRRSALRAIGPTWGANDVWLVIAVAVTLGAFPGWYAELMSGAYLPLVALVTAVMMRHAGMELVGHATPPSQARWERVIVATSHAVPFLWGLIWAGALDGSLAAGSNAGLGLVTAPGVAAGLALMALCRLQGLAFLRLRVPSVRADLPVRATARVAAALLATAAAVLASQAAAGVAAGPVAAALAVFAAAGVAAALRGAARDRGLWTLSGAAAATAGTTGMVLAVLYRVPIAGPGPHGVRLADAASGSTTLSAMLAITVVLLPALLFVLGFAYVRFLRAPADAPRGGVRALIAKAARGTMQELR